MSYLSDGNNSCPLCDLLEELPIQQEVEDDSAYETPYIDLGNKSIRDFQDDCKNYSVNDE